ncbi:MAG TPA: HAMP domain-containing sensor histidine kinase [Actinocrinis sp.]|uniref:HAMP domain-containing sensor histidine kinase n=1 Tax=Actinocrinis sp. TaxID=1920516 RepID=UPI002DDD0446|nr:HAMP domain-containing sensor histidine kinase [Actinocrinis sp.]HEV3168913.1 HAMP domain-containing sensor histidine kinase [Actinocrinis sp.]
MTRIAPEPGAEGESWRPAPALSASTTAGLPVLRDAAWPSRSAPGSEPERPGPMRRRRGGLHRRRFRLSGMRTRLFIGFAAVALITAAIITGSSYFLLRDSLLNRVASGAATELTDAVQLAGQQLIQSTSGPQDAQIASQLAKRGGYFVLVTPRGSAQSNSDIGIQDIPPSFMDAAKTELAQQRVIVRGVPYELTGTTLQSGGPQMFLFTPLDDEQNILTELITIGSVSGGLALVGAAGVAFLATRNVLVPIRRLGHAARMLGQGDLDVRLEVKGTDEIADVSHTFNETAAALARSMDELRAMDAASRRFVADVSHELRTPLTAMTAVTEVLEDVESADPTTISAAHLIANETKRLARLVEDLMEISRFDAGTAAMRVEDINLAELIEATLATRGWTSKVMVTAPPLVPARVDARRIDVVVANLVGNALKHGGEPVALQLYDQGEYVVVQVADSGPGIPAEALPHIFDRFYKADKARGRSEGSGLGLSIAFENARMHGGELSARNRPEGGAVFTLRFPSGSGGAAADDSDAPTWGASSDGSSRSGQGPSDGRRSWGESTSGGSTRDRQGART